MKKKFFRSIAHYLPQTLLLISLLTSNVLFPASVIAQEVENINEANTVTQEETVPTVEVDTSEDILEEGISTSIYEQESIPEIQIPPFTFENGIYTVNNVIQGEEYIYPENDNVRVKFTEITQGGNLIIKRVELTKEQKELLNTKDNYGWDITSNMENGTFKYDLTLPNIYDNTNVEVKYTEDGNNYESIQTNSIENNRIVINGLDHFTVFIVINPLPTGVSNGGTCTVASINGTCYNTIQGAINAASDGETINVASGTYTENIVINKAITLQGDNSNIPTINPSNTFNPILQVSTSGVTIKNIKIQGTGTNSHGISLLNGTNNLTLENVSSINNGGNGIEISLYDYQGPISNLTLNNCNLSNNNIGFRTGSTTKVKTLTITNTNAENNKTAGLYFNGPITGLTLDGGRYNNNKGSSNPTNGLGIYAVNFNNFPDGEKENMVLKNFTANGNIRGVIINQAYGPFSISNAEISNNSEEGLAVAPGANISGLSFDNIKANNNPKWGFWLISYLGYTINNVTITNSSFNISTGTSGYEGTGLYLYAATGSTLSNVNISNTSMNGNRIGLYMRTVDSTSTIRNIKAENSSFVGNTQYGAYNNDLISRTIDLTLNWWGNHTGPSGDGLSGSGDKINSNILYKEWLCQPYTTDLTRWVSQDGQCLLNAPTNLGWNVSSLTSNPGKTPVTLSCGSYTSDNTPSHVWGSVAGNNIKYQRQAKAPNGGWWTDPQIYTSTYTPFTYFGQSGQGNGWEGEWNSRVRAFYDEDEDGQYDEGEVTSSWSSDECKITYDKTAPSIPSNLSYTLNAQSLSCGSYTNIYDVIANWSASTDNISEVDHYEYQSFNPTTGWIYTDPNNILTNSRAGSFTVGQGTYGFRIRAVDKAGNKSDWSSTDFNSSCRITYDITAPIANILSHKDGDWIKGTTNITGQITDVNLMRYWFVIQNTLGDQVGGYGTTPAYNSPVNLNYSWNTSSLPDGQYTIKLEARDLANNKNPDPVSIDPNIDSDSIDWVVVNVDNTAPTGSITSIYYPSKNISVPSFITNDNTPILEGTYSDTNIDTVELTIDSTEQTLTYTDNKWRVSEPTASLSDGNHTATLTITDKAGNQTVINQNITIDTVLPTAEYKYYKGDQEITDSIAYVQKVEDLFFTAKYSDTTPSSGLYQDSFVIFEAQDDGSFNFSQNGKKAFCSWRKDPNRIPLSGTTYEQTSKVSFTNCISSLPNGEYYLAHQLYDNATRKDIPTINQFRDIVSLHFIIDNTAPTISGHSNITLTEGDTFPTDTVSLTDNYGISKVCGKGKDITNNIETSEICIDTNTTNLTGGQFTLMDVIRGQIEGWKGKSFTTVDLSIIPAGQYLITYYAFDKAGNKGNEETFTITIADNIPTVSITALTTQITQGSSVVLEAAVTNGNSPYTYKWSGACTGTEQTTTFTSASTGTYTCTVTVTDADGDSASSSIDITVGAVLGEATGPTEPTVKGATTTTKATTKKTTTTALTTTQDTNTTTEEIIDTSIEETSVLGATCENKKKVSGYVYIDKNKDEEMNNNEKGIKDVTLTIKYTDDQGNTKTEEVSTDEKGYWEVQLCSGKYSVVTDQNTLPKNIEIPETLSLTVSDNEIEVVFNIQALDIRNFWQKYWYLIVGGIAVILIAGTSIKNKKKEEV